MPEDIDTPVEPALPAVPTTEPAPAKASFPPVAGERVTPRAPSLAADAPAILMACKKHGRLS